MAVSNLLQFILRFLDVWIFEKIDVELFFTAFQIYPHRLATFLLYKRICRDKFCLKVWKRRDAVIVFCVGQIGMFLADERDKESQLCNLHGNRLDVNAKDAVFNDV